MDPQTKEMIMGRYEALPDYIQELITRPETSASVGIIADKHRLPEEKKAKLTDMVTLTLLCFEDVNRFEARVIEELLVPGSVAESIAHDIDNVVFSGVKTELAGLHTEWTQIDKEGSHQEYVRDTSPAYRAGAGEPPVVPPPPPSYAQPLTNTPRYSEDPYREEPA